MSHSSRYTTDAFDAVSYDGHSVEGSLRKRPKYTRSKTGCLTCRAKKIKCDEIKPVCSRCSHGRRECTWPDIVPTAARKRPSPTDPSDSRSVTAASSFSSPTGMHSFKREPSPPISLTRSHSLQLHIPSTTRYSPRYSGKREPSSLSHIFTGSSHSDVHYSSSTTHAHSPRTSYSLDGGDYSTSSLMPTLESPFVPPTIRSVRSDSVDNSPVDSHISGRPYSASSSQTSGHSPDASWHESTLRMSPDAYYPNSRERSLMQHFIHMSRSMLMASPATDDKNPVLPLHIPPIAMPYSGSASTEAHKYAVLSLAATHNAYLHHLHQLTHTAASEAMAEAQAMRVTADQHLAVAMSSPHDVMSDSTLAAAVVLTLADVFAGSHKDWDEHLAIGKSIIATRGGPTAIASGPMVDVVLETGERMRLCPGRILLDYVAVFEIFASLILAEESSLFAAGSSWWYIGVMDSPLHWSAVETIFGFSRDIMPLMAKIFPLFLRVSLLPEILTEAPPSSAAVSEVHCVWNEVQRVKGEVMNFAVSPPPPQKRVCDGNTILILCLQILILREMLAVPLTDPRIQSWTSTVISLVQECVIAHAGAGLLWQLIVAGCQISDTVQRKAVYEILDEFKAVSSFQVETARRLVEEVWLRMDMNHPRPHWRYVLEDTNIKVLLV